MKNSVNKDISSDTDSKKDAESNVSKKSGANGEKSATNAENITADNAGNGNKTAGNDKSSENNENGANEPRLKGVLVGMTGLSLGISMILAIIIGIGIGILLKNIFGVFWVFWIGVFWGVCAAILNVYKAYKSQMREFEAIENDPKYRYNKEK